MGETWSDNLLPMRISVADFGARPDGSDATRGVRAAVARLPPLGGAILHFPSGVYRFGYAPDPILHLIGIENLQIDATDCTFLFRDAGCPIVASRCRNIQLRGFTIDWERPPFSQGEVVGFDTTSGSLDLQIDREFPVDGSEKFVTLANFDRETGLMSRGGLDLYMTPPAIKLIGDQRLRLELNRRVPLAVGETVVVRHSLTKNSHAITLVDCDGVFLDGVRILASSSMAVVGGRCQNVKIHDLQVIPRPGSHRLMSTNADAVHFANGTGTIEITGSIMSGMGDDCINVHGKYIRLAEIQDARTAIVSNKNEAPFEPMDVPRNGDQFVFVDPRTLVPRGVASIVGSESGIHETLHFGENIPEHVEPGDLLCNVTGRAALTVSQCRFPGNRARGVLAHSDAVIENCFFANQFEQAILLAPDTFWMEGCAADRVRIANNEIRDSVRSDKRAQGAITIDAFAATGSAGMISRGIEIFSNKLFNSSAGTAISANAAQDIEIRDNTFETSEGSLITLHSVRKVTIKTNQFIPEGTVRIDTQSRNEVEFFDNVGLKT
jgi:hypothetical protein